MPQVAVRWLCHDGEIVPETFLGISLTPFELIALKPGQLRPQPSTMTHAHTKTQDKVRVAISKRAL